MYETGVGVALLVWLASQVFGVVERMSIKARNLRRFGMKVSALGELQPITENDAKRHWAVRLLVHAGVALIGLLSTLLSWVYVAFYVGNLAWIWSKQVGAPAEVREFRWRLKNIDMSLDDLIRASMKAQGIAADRFEEVRSAHVEDMRARGLL